MNVWISPSSGGKFAVQLGLLSEACGNLKEPTVFLGTSGGNLCSYMTLAGDFTSNGILRISNYINSSLFSHSWWSKHLVFLPSWIIGTFKGSIYKAGSGGDEVMNHIFTPYNISRVEIWTGTMESETGKAQLFCNKDQKESLLGNVDFDFRLKNCKPHKFLDGDISKIAKVNTASASIPVYVPNQTIDDIQYADGGTVYWSPLTPLSEVLDNISCNKPLHMTYFNGSDVESDCDAKCNTNIVQNTDITLDRILRTLAITDRLAGINLVTKYRKHKILYFEGECNISVLRKIQENLKYIQRSFLELYRKIKVELDITNFEASDIHRIITETRKCYYFRLWIAVNSDNENRVKNLF